MTLCFLITQGFKIIPNEPCVVRKRIRRNLDNAPPRQRDSCM